jgi:NAD+ diphosphatase
MFTAYKWPLMMMAMPPEHGAGVADRGRTTAFWGSGMDIDMGLGTVLKYCPKCGAAALRVVGLKMVRCAACGFELYLNPAAAVAGVIVDEQGRMVVLVRGKEPGKGKWDLPGGFADPGETVEDALRREVREEVGLEVTSLRYLGSWPNVYEYMGVRYRTVDMGFVCEAARASQATPREAEIAEVLFLHPREIDPGQFAFRSVGMIAGAYLSQESGGRNQKEETAGQGGRS